MSGDTSQLGSRKDVEKGIGMLMSADSTEDEAGPSKKPRTGHISETLLIEQSELLLKQYLFKPLPDSFLPSTGSQVLQWLFDFTELKVPVTPLFYEQMLALQGPQQCLIPVLVEAPAVTTFTDLLQTAPRLPFSSEQNTAVYVCSFIDRCWQTLAKYSPTNLHYDLMLNQASQLSNVSSHAMVHKLRPDTMLVADNCTLMLGEDMHTDLAAAYAALSRKRVDLSGMHYGPVKFMLGYAPAGTTVQWCFLPEKADQPVQVMGDRLDVRSAKGRLSFLLSLVQAYRLLAAILLMEGSTVLKQIKNFKKYEDRQKTCLAAIKRAYDAAGRAANEAKRAGNPQYLVTCASPPRLVKNLFEVRTLPCGYSSHVFSEQDLHAMASACCKAAQVLHTNKLVHRDFRLPNVVQLAHQQYMVIDLESVADVTAKRLPKNFHNVLKVCNAEALDADGRFTPLSDMYSIGVLLREAHVSVNSQAVTFIDKLMDKELTAEAALIWLQREWSQTKTEERYCKENPTY
ncbi:hypothetical protein ABBQ38_000064 [Trebouxia sp. C0009 RCD-2024]